MEDILMTTVAPTPAARLALMREQFDRLFAAIGDRMDRMTVAEESGGAAAKGVRDEERAVCDTITRVARMVEQSDREPDAVAATTLGACIAIIQGELPVRLRALSRLLSSSDPHAAHAAREWAADLEALSEGETATP